MKHFKNYYLTLVILLLRIGSLVWWVKCSPNSPGDRGSIPGRVIPKTLKMVLDTSLLNTQQYKVCIKGKEELYFLLIKYCYLIQTTYNCLVSNNFK